MLRSNWHNNWVLVTYEKFVCFFIPAWAGKNLLEIGPTFTDFAFKRSKPIVNNKNDDSEASKKIKFCEKIQDVHNRNTKSRHLQNLQSKHRRDTQSSKRWEKNGGKFCENQIGYREKCVNSMDGPPLCCQRSVNLTLYFRFHIGPLFLCWFLAVDPFNMWLNSSWEKNNYFHSKLQLQQFWVKLLPFCAFVHLVTTVIFFSAWDKSPVKWANSQKTT